jgi:hypothetical protein
MTAKLFGDVKPGDRLFRVTRGRRMSDPPHTKWVVVTKVGRKWVEFQPEDIKNPGKWSMGRFDIATGRLDMEYGTGGSIHRDEEGFRADEAAKAAWLTFRRAADRFTHPPGITAEDIAAAMKLLRLEPKA